MGTLCDDLKEKEKPCVMMVPKWFSSAPLLGLHSSLNGVVQPAGEITNVLDCLSLEDKTQFQADL